MKLKSLIMFSAAALAFAACSNDEDVTMPVNDEGTKSIILKINGSETRAITAGTPYGEETTLSSIDVYFTNSNSTVQQSYRLLPSSTDGDTQDKNWDAITSATGLRFVGLDNVSAVYIVANSPEAILGKGKKLDTDFMARLRQQGPALEQGQIIFAGNDIDITPVAADTNNPDTPTYNDPENEPGANDQVYTANVMIRPILSRMEWGAITIQHEGSVERQMNNKRYIVEWKNWNPTLSGIYQSSVYLADYVFAATGKKMNTLFDTPQLTSAIVDGAWTAPTGLETNWTAINATLAYTGYADNTYSDVLPADYDGEGECVPFHFFVPFETTSSEKEVDGNLGENPGWHFQFYYPEEKQNEVGSEYTVTIYAYDEEAEDHKGAVVDVDTDDDALAVMGDFLFPVRADDLAYANVYSLNGGSEGSSGVITYKPGKIYNADITIAPYNITAGFRELTDYNVIVKVSVADFEKVAVTPNFDKN